MKFAQETSCGAGGMRSSCKSRSCWRRCFETEMRSSQCTAPCMKKCEKVCSTPTGQRALWNFLKTLRLVCALVFLSYPMKQLDIFRCRQQSRTPCSPTAAFKSTVAVIAKCEASPTHACCVRHASSEGHPGLTPRLVVPESTLQRQAVCIVFAR